jgi:hypothetical protein
MKHAETLAESFKSLVAVFGSNRGAILLVTPGHDERIGEGWSADYQVDVFAGAFHEGDQGAVLYDSIIVFSPWDTLENRAEFSDRWQARGDLFQDFYKLLNPGGTLIFVARNGFDLRNPGGLIAAFWRTISGVSSGAVLFSKYKSELAAAGFTRLDRFYVTPGFSSDRSDPIRRVISTARPAMQNFLRWHYGVTMPSWNPGAIFVRLLVWLGIPALRMSWQLILARR